MKETSVTPFKTVNLSHRIYHFASRDDKFYAACSRDGIVTLLSSDFSIERVFNCSDVIKKKGDGIRIFILHPYVDIFCIGSEDEYRIYTYQGNLVCSMLERIEAIYHNPDTNLIWKVRQINDARKEISLIINDLLQDKIEIEDELYQSAVEFSLLPESNMICMTLLAGQDGMMTYLLTNDNGKIEIQHIEKLDENAILDFSDDKAKFLALDPDSLDKISMYSYPALTVSGELLLPEEEKESDHQFGFNDYFIDNTYALIEMGENLFYILNTEKMKIEGKLIVEGHEPKSISYYWPRLKDDDGETTNLAQFFKTPAYLIASFKASPNDNEDNSIVVVRRSDIIAALNQ
ncbi:MAG: hypothetical protein LBV43_11835 [Prevotella sp.]|jgi:hypothetical protein|nr:hypothetical protein [Prevotella sp.]